jgi:hypothetical protein
MTVELDNNFKKEIEKLPKIWVYRVSLNSDKGGVILDNWEDVLATLQEFIDEDKFSDKNDCQFEYSLVITREQMFEHEFESLGEFPGW